MYQNKVGTYQQNDVLTADSMTLVVMCYGAAISNLKIAKARYLENQFEAKGKAINKALDIIGELIGALNFEKGGQIAGNLNAIYEYLLRRIAQADTEKDMTALDDAIKILEELKDAWKEIHEPKGAGARSQPASQATGYGSMSVAWAG